MSDIHQEWHELRKNHVDFINHLDGEMAKLDKKQVELKRHEQLQNLSDAGAFAMQFVAPPPFNCCQHDYDILKALNKNQVDRIKHLEDEILAYKNQQDVDLAVKKDLDERISELSQEVIDLRERLVKTNESLKRSIQIRQCQAKEIVRLREIVNTPNGSCSAYAQQGMQSKITKQAAEIKRLTEENERLSRKNDELSGQYEAQKVNVACTMEMWHKYAKEAEDLKKALDIAAKDANANFERGKIKGMEEIWDELGACYDGRPIGENQKIFGYCTVDEMLLNLSPTWFMNKAEEYRKQKEQQVKVIQIGDEVEVFDTFCPDGGPHSDIGIVIAIDKDHPCFAVIGPNFEGCFDETDIQEGSVKKTGRHFDSIPLDYLA